MKLYLAGPMRGIPANNAPAFHAAAARLRAAGYDIWSPAEHDEALGEEASNMAIAATFKRDLNALMECDGIMLLPGWADSEGARLELHAAETVRLRVYLYLPETGHWMRRTRRTNWTSAIDYLVM